MILEKVPTISQSHEQHLVMIARDVCRSRPGKEQPPAIIGRGIRGTRTKM